MGLVQDATGNDLTYRIIGAAMKVHNDLGPGYKEEIYERALASQLNKNGIGAKTQVPIEVWHSDSLVGLFYLDIFVEEQVVVEIKAFRHQLTNDELAQVINYLKASCAPVGLLLNFGRRKLQFRCVFPSKDNSPVRRVGRDNVKKANLPDVNSGDE